MADRSVGGAYEDRLTAIMDDRADLTRGDAARAMTLGAGVAVAEVVRSTLGPNGMDKMLVDGQGSIVVTSDGATVLSEMDLDHPAGTLVREVATAQDEAVGDGTTTAMVLLGGLLSGAGDLLSLGLHPRTLVDGIHLAGEHAVEWLEDASIGIDPDDADALARVASTAMTGKLPAGGTDALAAAVVEAVSAAAENGRVDVDDVGIEMVPGGRVSDSRLVDGVALNRDPIHIEMPERVEDARIAIVGASLELPQLTPDVRATITHPDQLERFVAREEDQAAAFVRRIVEVGADVVVTEKGIDDTVQHLLATRGILTLRRARESTLDHLARATGGTRAVVLEDLTEAALGRAGLVERRDEGSKELVVVEGCPNPRTVTVLLRGGTELVVESTKAAVEDALAAVALAVEDGRVLPGGGAPEIGLARSLRNLAEGVDGREALAVEAVADALEGVPRTLAANAGANPIDTLLALRTRHARGEDAAGVDAATGEPADMHAAGVREPLAVKRGAIESARAAAVMLLRVDDVIASADDLDDYIPDTSGLDGVT